MAEEKKSTWNKVNQWAEELELLHNIIAKTGLDETVKWGAPVFTYNGKNVIGTGGFKNYFAIWFFNGVFLKDPKKVLVNAQEGVTKSLRQWRFTTKDELDEKLIIAYIQEAIENEKEGKIVRPTQKSKSFVVPQILRLAIEKAQLDTNFKAFTVGKQYEFVEYVDTAKRDETKLSRIDKILPMIRDGVGLNDKYR